MTNINNTAPGDQYLTTEIINNINSSINLSLVNMQNQSDSKPIPENSSIQSNLETPAAQSNPNQLNLNETIQEEKLNEKTGMNITTKTFLNLIYKLCLWVCLLIRLNQFSPNYVWDLSWPQGMSEFIKLAHKIFRFS